MDSVESIIDDGYLVCGFSKLFRFDIENYALYILSGQIIFNYFQSSTTDAMTAILGNGSLIKKVYLPKYMLVLAKILSGAVNLFASFLALLVVMLVTGNPITSHIAAVILPFLCLIVFSLGAGLFLAAVTVRFRDILHLYGVFCTALFYLTPIIYPISILPDYMIYIVSLNPLTRMVGMFRTIILDGRIPTGTEIAVSAGYAFLMLAFGAFVFKKRQKHFIMEI